MCQIQQDFVHFTTVSYNKNAYTVQINVRKNVLHTILKNHVKTPKRYERAVMLLLH